MSSLSGKLAWATIVSSVITVILTIAWLSKLWHEQSGFSFTFPTDPDDGDGPWHVFNWHPLCMIIAYGFLFPNAVIAFKALNGPKLTRKYVHMSIQTLAVIFSILGLVAVVRFKDFLGYPQVYSVHAWIGVVAFGLFGLQYLFGFLMFFYPRAPDAPRAAFAPYHVWLGFAIFVATSMAIVTGLQDRMSMFRYDDDVRSKFYTVPNFIALFLFITFALVLGQHVGLNKINGATADEQKPLYQPLNATT